MGEGNRETTTDNKEETETEPDAIRDTTPASGER